jgi:Tol biopolymer transport system component
VLSNLMYSPISTGTADRTWVSAADDGTAVYTPGDPLARKLVWLTLDGKSKDAVADRWQYGEPSLAPDGDHIAGARQDIWVIHTEHKGITRLTSKEGDNNLYPVWSRDGKTVIFSSNRNGNWEMYTVPENGSQASKLRFSQPMSILPQSTAPDGSILYLQKNPDTLNDLYILTPDNRVIPVATSKANEFSGQFSPDGKYVAYVCDESGRNQIYIAEVGGAHIEASSEGGVNPVWAPNGHALYYRQNNDLMELPLPASPIRPGEPKKIMDMSQFSDWFTISPDGKRFLTLKREPEAVPNKLQVILNWTEELSSKLH